MIMLELKKESVQMLRVKSKATSQVTFDVDYNVPDAKPDVGRMVQSKADVSMDEVRLSEGKAFLKGSLNVDLLYVGEQEGRVYSLSAKLPMDETMNLEGIEGGDKLCLSWEIEDLSIHVIHSRKLNIKAIVTFFASVDELAGLQIPVSLEEADKQIGMVVGILILAGVVILLFISTSSYYFMKSILTPIKEIGATARRIAQGDFKARIEKSNDDEIGQLCDTINDMAVELGTAERMKNDFISSVSHELRTPLTAIKGWAETITEVGDDDKATFSRGMGIIIRESERLSGIVEELLDFSRMQSGRMTLTMEKIDILAELGEAVYMFSDRARSERKFLLYDEPAMLSPVLGDINRLRQVFVNIIDNALKYTAEGGTISVAAMEAEGLISVVISDDGCGIPAEHLPNVKKKFYKANQTIRGSGIGLALADEIMRLHNGSLTIESQENVGTTVTITIPVLSETGDERKQEPNA